MNHTPTPWQLKGPLDVSDCEKDRLLTIGMPIDESREGFEEAQKNAAFIVEAVNNHYRLKGAIGKALDELERDYTMEAAQTLKEALGLREAGKEKS